MNIACYVRDDAVFHQVQGVLARAGFNCERFLSEVSLLRMHRRQNFDLIFADIGSSLVDKEHFFSWLTCRSGEITPVVLLSSTRNADLAALALDSGADDFIVKPFDPLELVARLNAVLRRCKRNSVVRAIESVGFSLDRESSTFLDRGTPIELTPREFTMAWLFFSTPGVYISRDTISAAIWGVDSDIAGRTIEQHIYKLRKKLQLGPARGVILRTAYTHGYRLELAREE